MNLTDATLVLLLAARIHGTDEAVRASAKSVVKKLPRSKRDPITRAASIEGGGLGWLASGRWCQFAIALG